MTGGAGFVGATLVRRLIASGHTVRVFDNLSTGHPDHPIEYQPTRRGEVDRNFANYELAGKLIGYAPTIAREDGLPSTWEWFSEYVFRG